MAKIYYQRVRDGAMTLEQVPALWRDAVAALLEADKTTPENENTEEV